MKTKLTSQNLFHGITKELIETAKIEIEAENIIEQKELRNKDTGYLTEECYEFFCKNHAADLVVYKQQKSSGYSLIALYKGIFRVGSADFMTSTGKQMEKDFAAVEGWPVYKLEELKRKMLHNIFEDPHDRRTKHEYKPSVEKIWAIIEECIAI